MIRSLSARLARLEVHSAIGKDPRKLTDAQLDAEIRALAVRIDPADLSPTERELLQKALEPGGTGR
jgi:hypothetical protein